MAKQTMEALIGWVNDLDFYSRSNEKVIEGFLKGAQHNQICLLKISSGGSVENGLWAGSRASVETESSMRLLGESNGYSLD